MSRLCAIADVSRKSYYAYIKRRHIVDEELQRILAFIRQVQAVTVFAVGYRHMTQKIRNELSIQVNHKRVQAIMNRYGLLSVVRRKKYTPQQYKRRREMKALTPKNLLDRMNIRARKHHRSLIQHHSLLQQHRSFIRNISTTNSTLSTTY